MMIRAGKYEGWLSLQPSAIPTLARFSQVKTNGVKVVATEDKGLSLLATERLTELWNPLISVPNDLILSKESVFVHAKSDPHLRQVLEACGDFAQTPRHSILIFLLVQITYLCPHLPNVSGTQHPFTNYIKFLPCEWLPTFWTEDELALANGTTLKPATEAKLNSLYREYEQLQRTTSIIPWCEANWWDSVEGLMGFEDWKHVDAMYRSRALEFPRIGDCMVPHIDFANHAAGEKTTALYDADSESNGLLLLRQGKCLEPDEEVSITYGDEKGACEMIFSYGFLEDGTTDANTLFLDITITDDDPLKLAKQAFAHCAPGVRLTVESGSVTWESEYLWLMLVNEEDGLDISVAMTTNGQRELSVKWMNEDISDTSSLEQKLKAHPLWDVFQLRAVAILETRIEQQLNALDVADAQRETIITHAPNMREAPKTLTRKLASLERKLLEECKAKFTQQRTTLIESDVVQEYLEAQQPDDDAPPPQEDFS